MYLAPSEGPTERDLGWSVLYGEFHPGDDLAGALLALDDMALVVIWDVGANPELESWVISCPLGEQWAIELPAGRYHVTALVFDEARDEVLAGGAAEWFVIAANTTTFLSLPLHLAEGGAPTGVFDTVGESSIRGAVILPDGSAVLLDGVVTLGRAGTSAILFQDNLVSRQHAQIHETADGYWIADLGSANGTFVNDQRVATCRLRDGDLIRIGIDQLVFLENASY